MSLSIMPKNIMKEIRDEKKSGKKDEKNIKDIYDEGSFYEVDILRSREIEKTLKYQLEVELGLININTEPMNGMIYENGELIYEGEYLQGKGNYASRWYAHGYGKAYYENEVLEYEGNFMYGHPQGYGKYYYINGQLRWKGIFEAAVGIERLDLWKSSLGYVDKKGRIRYGEAYDINGKLVHYGDFDKRGNPIKWYIPVGSENFTFYWDSFYNLVSRTTWTNIYNKLATGI